MEHQTQNWVSEEETLNLMVKHMGRHVSTDQDAFNGGRKLAMMMNGVKVARMYQPEDRLIPLMLAAEGAAGRLGDRPERRPLPPPIDWQKLEDWIRVFTADKEWEGIEKCLITARRLGGHDEKIVPLIVGLARWATDIRRNAGNDSAVQTAHRFARGETATELYE